MIDIPVIETKRLTLCAHSRDDIEPIRRYRSSKRAKYAGYIENCNALEAWNVVTSGLGQWALRGYGGWCLRQKGEGTAVGGAGIFHPIDWPEPEFGYVLYDAQYEGQGYISEAAQAILNFAADHLGLDRVCSYIDRDNQASLNVAARLGATYEKEITLRDRPALVFRHQTWKSVRPQMITSKENADE